MCGDGEEACEEAYVEMGGGICGWGGGMRRDGEEAYVEMGGGICGWGEEYMRWGGSDVTCILNIPHIMQGV